MSTSVPIPQDRALRSRLRILEAAGELFATKGFEATTIGLSGKMPSHASGPCAPPEIFAYPVPVVVVLIFCANNDRDDNSSNIRYEGYQKPYFTTSADGSTIESMRSLIVV